jgi:taspase (threonine aspartase 1)
MFNRMRNPKSTDSPAIFVHAGAGFHSTANEHVHLQACNEYGTYPAPKFRLLTFQSACQAAMGILSAGGSAVDAVEIAIKILEDREITNAGYGSNLSMDGVVECDALVVDHMGKSGGVGAIARKSSALVVRSYTEKMSRGKEPNLCGKKGPRS